jgi:hypothetical protein
MECSSEKCIDWITDYKSEGLCNDCYLEKQKKRLKEYLNEKRKEMEEKEREKYLEK